MFLASCVEAQALMEAIDALAPDDLDGVRRLGSQLRAALEATPIPSSLDAALRAAFAESEGQDPGSAW